MCMYTVVYMCAKIELLICIIIRTKMSQSVLAFYKEFNGEVINEKLVQEIKEYVEKDTAEFNESLLYKSDTKEKILDKEIRNSVFKNFVDEKLFDMVEKVVSDIEEKDKFKNYTLVRNDISYIKYGVGGFFKPHSDYLSYRSNILEEYTLIICLDANCEGGETVFEINEYFKYASKSTITPYNAVLFRKDLVHASNIITSGYKHIITANILAYPKESYQDGKFLIILFPNSQVKYILTKNDIDSIGDNFLSEIDMGEKKTVIYLEETVDPENFEIIYKIYKKAYITHRDFKKVEVVLRNYYRIELQNILITYDEVKPDIVKLNNNTFDFNQDLLLFPTKEEMLYYQSISEELGHNFTTFKIIFAEGYVGGEKTNEHLDMMPVYMSATEDDNLLFMYKLYKSIYDEIREYKYNLEDDRNIKHFGFDFGPEACGKIIYADYISFEHLQTLVAKGKVDFNTKTHIFHELGDDDYSEFSSSFHHHGFRTKLIDFSNRDIISYMCNYKFEKEDLGKGCLMYMPDKPIFKLINKKMKEINFFETVKRRINDIPIILKQYKESLTAHFCNESVYGFGVLIEVYGLLKCTS